MLSQLFLTSSARLSPSKFWRTPEELCGQRRAKWVLRGWKSHFGKADQMADQQRPLPLPLPDEFLCPITHELMTDPVITADGQSYERNAINQWFQRGALTSPATGAVLPSNILTPNHALRNAINKFNEHLPFLQNHLTEITEMRQRLERKELEIRDHIKNGLTLVSIIDLAEISNKLQSSTDLLSSQNLPPPAPQTETAPAAAEETKGPSSSSSSSSSSSTTQIKFTPQESAAYEQSLISSLIINQQQSQEQQRQLLLSQVKEINSKQSQLKTDIQSCQDKQASTQIVVEELRLSMGNCQHTVRQLKEQQAGHEIKLTELSQRYSEMAHDLMGQSHETSQQTLQDLRTSAPVPSPGSAPGSAPSSNPSSGEPSEGKNFVMPKSPILQEYLRVVTQIKSLQAEVTLQLRNFDHHEEEQHQCHDLLVQLQFKIIKMENSCKQLHQEEKKLLEQIQQCEHYLHEITATQQDLHDAIKWSRNYSQGLLSSSTVSPLTTSPSPLNSLTLPLILLFYKIFCRLEISENGKESERLMREGLTPARLRRWGCEIIEIKKGGYSANEMKEAGYGLSELRRAGWSGADLKSAGWTLAEFMSDGVTGQELRVMGYTAAQLKSAGFSTMQLRTAGFT
jgi:hypothetical protein